MYKSIAEFLADWKYESGATLKIMETLTDASLGQRVSPEGRTLGYLAWHVVQTLGEMGTKAGLPVDVSSKDAPVPDSVERIAAAYRSTSRSLSDQIKCCWDDHALAEEVELYGERWTRTKVLVALVRHQAHHRGQMTVLMRQAGLVVPGVYGPSREEWVSRGRPPQP